jgi:hypothetical protein
VDIHVHQTLGLIPRPESEVLAAIKKDVATVKNLWKEA